MDELAIEDEGCSSLDTHRCVSAELGVDEHVIKDRSCSSLDTHWFMFAELGVNELAIEDGGTLGGRRDQPQHKQDLHLEVKRDPKTHI